MKPPYYAALMLVIHGAIALHHIPFICISTPNVTVEAGSTVMATIDNPQARPCEAIVTFSDPDFLPVRFGFQALKCPGLQQAEFAMPVEAPNGGASILWRCAGKASPTCSHVWITQGQGDFDLIGLDQYGTIGCLLPPPSTSTPALTTMINALAPTYLSTSPVSSSSPVPGAVMLSPPPLVPEATALALPPSVSGPTIPSPVSLALNATILASLPSVLSAMLSSVLGATTPSSSLTPASPSSVPGTTTTSSSFLAPNAIIPSSLSSVPGATTPPSTITPSSPLSLSVIPVKTTPSSLSSSLSVSLTMLATTFLTLTRSIATSGAAPF